MEGFHLKTFEVKTSKTGLSVPVINGVHLHSSYDPLKEAQTLADKYRDSIRVNNKVLIFGLGFGYHVELIVNLLKRYHKTYEVYVIEPVHKVFEGCRRLKRITDNNVSIYAGHKIETLYSDTNLVDFLSVKPVIIGHPASMNLHGQYFKNFMSFEASEHIVNISSNLASHDLKRSFEKYKPGGKYDEFVADLRKRRGKFHKSDYLILAVEEMAQ